MPTAQVPAPPHWRTRMRAVRGAVYPFKGILHLLRHRYLWPLIRTRLLPCTLLSTFILVNLFLWTYIPQVAFLAIFHGLAGAWINGTILVLGEGAAIIALLFEAFLVDETLVDIFDAVMVEKGWGEMIRTMRPVEEGTVDEVGRVLDPRTRLGRPTKSSVFSPFSLRQIVEFVILLPLNFIPVVGVPIFLVLTGYRAGPFQHWRLFQLRGYTKKERKAFVKRHVWSYTWYGTVHLMLQLVPVLSMFFLMTNAAASALWASDMETQRRAVEGQPSSEPDYRDDPV